MDKMKENESDILLHTEQIAKTFKKLLVSPSLDSLKCDKTKKVGTSVIKTVLNLVGAGAASQGIELLQTIDECELFRKFVTYIINLKDTTLDDRTKFCEEIEKMSNDYSGNIIMGMMDRLDGIEKGRILANLTIAKIKNFITKEDFFRLSTMLERIPFVDLPLLENYGEPYYDENGDSELLFATGAIRLSKITEEKNYYSLSKMGILLLRYGCNEDVSKYDSNTKGTEVDSRIFYTVENETLYLK